MTGPLGGPPDPLPNDPRLLAAEIGRLRELLRQTQIEKERALRLLRTTNTDLSGRVQGQTQQLRSLHQLITTISASLDVRAVAEAALAGLQQLLRVEQAVLALADSHGTISYFLAQPPEHLAKLAGAHPTPGEGLLGRALAQDPPQGFVLNAVTPAELSPAEQAAGLAARNALVQPVAAHGRLIGLVQLVNKWAGPFTDADRNFTETVCGSLAVAIENARVYEEVQAQVRALERTNTELVATQGRLVQSARLASVGELAAGLAHEINNPVGVILGFAQLVAQRAEEDKLRGYGELIEREAQRVQRIVGNLMGLARQATAEPVRLDLRLGVERALQLLEYQLEHDGIRVTRQAAAAPLWVRVDPDQLLQVLLNVIQNARQVMPRGGELVVRTWADPARHYCAIEDTGPGLPPEVLARLGEPFFTTKPPGEGNGLGLSVSRSILQRHGGELRAANRPEGGASFVICLPAVE
jgi:signal transduction histidine kinase